MSVVRFARNPLFLGRGRGDGRRALPGRRHDAERRRAKKRKKKKEKEKK